MSLIALEAFRAISVRHVWAWAIAAGVKDCENRGFKPRGWDHTSNLLLIHAGLSSDGEDEARERMLGMVPRVTPPPRSEIVRGAILCAVYLSAFQMPHMDRRRWSAWCDPTSRVWWRLSSPIKFPEPVPCEGRQGLFVPDREVLTACVGQILKASGATIPGGTVRSLIKPPAK